MKFPILFWLLLLSGCEFITLYLILKFSDPTLLFDTLTNIHSSVPPILFFEV